MKLHILLGFLKMQRDYKLFWYPVPNKEDSDYVQPNKTISIHHSPLLIYKYTGEHPPVIATAHKQSEF